jgi:uncharacterized protein (TIGR02117 family)
MTRYILVLIFIGLTTVKPRSAFGSGETIEVYIVQQALHTGIVFRMADVNLEIWPESKDFEGYEWIDVGWGDYEYYQSPDEDPWLAFKAIAMPTTAVLRVDGFSISPDRYYGNSPRLRFCFSREQFDQLCRTIHLTYLRDELDKPKISGKGYGLIFYAAKGKYHLFNTCNTWVADAFHTAGLSNRRSGIITARQLFSFLRRFECV